ncbi:Isoaspartyl peptidase [Salmonella enterica subsp. enterica]|nr:Isoaspartyl peptidase [Salmonella enterica subsp. enterica]
MDGNTLKAGAVAGVSHVRHPVLAARLVMERSPHVLMVWEGAENFAFHRGWRAFRRISFPPRRVYEQLLAARAAGEMALDHSGARWTKRKKGYSRRVARDKFGNLAAATSTAGMTNKLPGARRRTARWSAPGVMPTTPACRRSCTGTGEVFIRTLAAYDIAH